MLFESQSFKYPAEKYSIAWLFDHSSCHCAFADDGLNAKKMNVRPRGNQPKMQDTIWAGRLQSLVDEDGVPKGMKQVLRERGINTEQMVADDMRVHTVNAQRLSEEAISCWAVLNSPRPSSVFYTQVPL